jgi:hypothetical protein
VSASSGRAKTATEAAVRSLNPVMLSVFFLFLKLTLARKAENAIFHSNLLRLVLDNIDHRRPFGDSNRFLIAVWSAMCLTT